MKITKYLHSCLLIEEHNMKMLIDPGNYTYEAGVLPLNELQQLDYLLITHEHDDHCCIPLINDILRRFPTIQIISNNSVVAILKRNNIPANTKEREFIQTHMIPHEKLPIGVTPQNTGFTLFNKLTDPGDSHHFSHTAPILALPMQAPWGSYVTALELAIHLRPQHVIPIHDWHWKDEARKVLYQRAKLYLKQFEIMFHNIETGETIEI